MDLKTEYLYRTFPPIIIEVIKWKSGSYTHCVTDSVPEKEKYPPEVKGVWRIKYKEIDPTRAFR